MNRSDLKKFIADIFLPNRCPGCSKVITWNECLCKRCKDKLVVISSELCKVCGKKHCLDHSKLCFETCISLYYFEQPCINAVYALKHSKATGFAEYCAGLLAKELQDRGLTGKIDLVTCVPMSQIKLRKRRYNQAELFAKCLCKCMNKPFDNSLLVHSDTLTEHHKLVGRQRKENAENSFFPSQEHSYISGKTILLCDDVYTTGSTMNTCAECLQKLGAKSVIAVSIATTEHARESGESSADNAEEL